MGHTPRRVAQAALFAGIVSPCMQGSMFFGPGKPDLSRPAAKGSAWPIFCSIGCAYDRRLCQCARGGYLSRTPVEQGRSSPRTAGHHG